LGITYGFSFVNRTVVNTAKESLTVRLSWRRIQYSLCPRAQTSTAGMACFV